MPMRLHLQMTQSYCWQLLLDGQCEGLAGGCIQQATGPELLHFPRNVDSDSCRCPRRRSLAEYGVSKGTVLELVPLEPITDSSSAERCTFYSEGACPGSPCEI